MRVIRMLHPQIENYKNTYFKNKKKMNEEEMDKAAWTKITFSLCVTCKNKYWNTIFQEKHIPLFLFRSHRIVAVVSLGTDQHLWSHSRYFLPFADLLPISRSKAHRSMVKITNFNLTNCTCGSKLLVIQQKAHWMAYHWKATSILLTLQEKYRSTSPFTWHQLDGKIIC